MRIETTKLTQIELPQKAGILHLAKVHRQHAFLEERDVVDLEGTAVGLEANDLTENLPIGHPWQLSITVGVGRHGIVQHPVQLEGEEGGRASSSHEYRGGLLLLRIAIAGGRGGRDLGVVVVVVLDELPDVAMGCDLAVQLDLRGRRAALAAARTSGARRGVGVLVGHEDVAEGRISRLRFVGNSTGGGACVEGRS